MNLTGTWTDEQRELAAAITDLAADRCDSSHRRKIIAEPPHWDPALWQSLVGDLGIAGIAIEGTSGGVGGDFLDASVVIEEASRALLPTPITTHLLAAEALRGYAADDLLGALAAGESIATLGVADRPGVAQRVLHAAAAEVFVIAAAGGLFVVRRGSADVSVSAQPSLDLTRHHAAVHFDQATAAQVGDADAAGRAVDVLRIGLALEAVGVARWCLDTTVAYLKVREQFGKPIGSFQALQHRCADLAVDLEAAISTARYAAAVVATSDPSVVDDELPIVAPLAKSVCCDAAAKIAAETIQLHGGIGFTWEHDAHLYFKRATVIAAMLGSSGVQRGLVADRIGL